RPELVPGPRQGGVATDHQRWIGATRDDERRRPGAGERVDRRRFDAGHREGPAAAGEHVRRPGRAGDDPGGVRIAAAAHLRRAAAEESPAPAGDILNARSALHVEVDVFVLAFLDGRLEIGGADGAVPIRDVRGRLFLADDRALAAHLLLYDQRIDHD